MDANGDVIPDNMLYYPFCMGKMDAKPVEPSRPIGEAGGGPNLGKVKRIRSGHVPDSLRHPSGQR